MNAQNPSPRPAADSAAIWEPRQAEVAKSVAQYSRFVSAMKLALPVAAGILLLLVVVLPQFRSDDDRFRIGMNLIKGSNSDALSMTNARYFGTDDKGQPYSVTAGGVRQAAKDDRAIDLIAPKAEISLTNGTYLSAEAAAGLYDRDNQKLNLSGEVTVTQGKDTQLRTTSAIVMLKEGTASGREPVSGDGSFGLLQSAGGFELSDRGKVVRFLGPSKLTINPKASAKTNPVPPSATPGATP
jgi:lipopolysaccharide export system protein LptC